MAPFRMVAIVDPSQFKTYDELKREFDQIVAVARAAQSKLAARGCGRRPIVERSDAACCFPSLWFCHPTESRKEVVLSRTDELDADRPDQIPTASGDDYPWQRCWPSDSAKFNPPSRRFCGWRGSSHCFRSAFLGFFSASTR